MLPGICSMTGRYRSRGRTTAVRPDMSSSTRRLIKGLINQFFLFLDSAWRGGSLIVGQKKLIVFAKGYLGNMSR
jgi:hypothetical protein